MNRPRQDFAQLRLAVLLLGIRRPVRDFARKRVFLGLYIFVKRDHPLRATPAKLHQRFVDGNAYEPSIELRLTLKLLQVIEGF